MFKVNVTHEKNAKSFIGTCSSFINLDYFFLGAAEYNFTFVPHFTRFHWPSFFPVVLQHVNISTLADVNSKCFSCS